MFKLIILLVVLIISGLILAPFVFEKFAIWDASNPNDGKSSFNLLLNSLTPHVPASIINQTIAINQEANIIDVRSQEEYENGHIKNAINIPEETLYQIIPKQFKDKQTIIYLYSNIGHRGATATRLLRSMGYEKAFNIENGLKGWEKVGLPTVKPYPAYF